MKRNLGGRVCSDEHERNVSTLALAVKHNVKVAEERIQKTSA